MIVLLSLLVLIAGVLMMAYAKDPKLYEMGKMMFFAGLLAFLLQDAAVVNLFTTVVRK